MSIADEIRFLTISEERDMHDYRYNQAITEAADIAAAGESALRAELKVAKDTQARHSAERLEALNKNGWQAQRIAILEGENGRLRAEVEALRAEREVLIVARDMLGNLWGKAKSERDRLAADLAVARDALAFYAEPTLDGYDVMVTNYGLSTDEGAIILDKGDIARAALAALGVTPPPPAAT